MVLYIFYHILIYTCVYLYVRKEDLSECSQRRSCVVSAATRAPPPSNYYRLAVRGTNATQWRRSPSAADTLEDLRCEHPE